MVILSRFKRMGLLLLGLFCLGISGTVWADNLSVFCSSPKVSAPVGGGTFIANVNCVINAPDVASPYRITGSADNFLLPALMVLNRGLSVLTATRLPTVSSPDNTINSILGTSSGFEARLSKTESLQTLRFQYTLTTTSSTPAGNYVSLTPAQYKYQICTTPSCNQQVFSGVAPVSLAVEVVSAPVTVSCASPSVEATPGGGPFTLTVLCSATGGNPGKFSPTSQNIFSPGTVTLSNGANNLTTTLQNTVVSLDSSVTGLTGTPGSGFTGNITGMPANIQIQYRGTTTNATPAGTYTSNPLAFTWSTL